MTEQAEAKTIGYTPFHYCSDRPLFRVNGGVPLTEALQQASDLLHLAYRLAEDATFERKTDRHAWAAHYLMEMSKAVIDDVVKVMTVRPEGSKHSNS
ncbi:MULTISPECIES: DUF3077 domain-containing protein [unclassified Pseudomonas]|uniref:DUF3077 domain-containing protein n=1 Tax=unclassified Pseudomonas TaxID=196821 RepID=UPI0008769977|nr:MULTISPECIES: DUF3077 domain-containing protein [unclassified Pseudomonas]SCZ19754.1 Protein of unknown function [Pseudomonas sp. NFACC44-2]SDA45753.1 Protein of unknown function [Pseudomonas sp. NFACC51]SDB15652.1 Protein of unknown function [Pseudomonas sp. NFACC17-2]SEI44770.1 Protein of unknown function [Pseudomonas sp. NFACC07-1]SEJ17872.1 Protein of unknown function [Pseudomonas sp. NFACC23-1]